MASPPHCERRLSALATVCRALQRMPLALVHAGAAVEGPQDGGPTEGARKHSDKQSSPATRASPRGFVASLHIGASCSRVMLHYRDRIDAHPAQQTFSYVASCKPPTLSTSAAQRRFLPLSIHIVYQTL